MKTRQGVVVIVLSLLVLTGGMARADGDGGDATASAQGTVLQAGGEARTQVSNDTLTISLVLERDDSDAAELNRAVMAAAKRALEQARKVTAVKTRTAGYGFFPVYDKGRIVRHRASYRISLETRDFAAGLALAARMAPFQVRQLSFSVSPETRQATEKSLLRKAIADMREKFAIVADSLGSKAFRITRVTVSPSQFRPIPLQGLDYVKAMARTESVPAEAGESTVSVSVSGTARME